MQSIHSLYHNFRPLIIVLYLSIMGMACTSAVMFYMGMTPDLLIGLIFMGFVFFIYMINRFSDIQEDFANDIKKVLFFTNHKILFKIGIAVIILAGVGLATVNKLNLFHIILISTGILYSYRFIPWYKRGRGILYYRIKDLPFLKNLIVALLWGTSIFIICMPVLTVCLTIIRQGCNITLIYKLAIVG